MTQIIAFAGQKGSGKDTAAAALDGFENVKMAGGLKAMLAAFLAYQGAGETYIHECLEGHLKEKPCPYLGGRTPRFAMQTLGTEWGRDTIDKEIWIAAAERRIGLFDNVVISDIRFPNEVEMVKRIGGYVYRIVRPNGAGLTDFHASEAQIDSLQVHGTIINDAPTAEAFAENLFCAVEGLNDPDHHPQAMQHGPPVWIETVAGECPVHPTQKVEVELRDRTKMYCRADDVFWGHLGRSGDVMRWRVR